MNKVPVLFDVNGSFGKGAAGDASFATLRERLDFMDRFGMSRSQQVVFGTDVRRILARRKRL